MESWKVLELILKLMKGIKMKFQVFFETPYNKEQSGQNHQSLKYIYIYMVQRFWIDLPYYSHVL